MTEVYISGLAIDSATNSPVVILKEPKSQKILPIWIGLSEASVIALELSNVSYRRPLTHDLIKSILNVFDATLQRIVINSIKDNTFFAKIYLLASENSIIEIDARPSDSLALALKMKAPIYISDEIEENLVDVSDYPNDLDPGSEIKDENILKNRLKNIEPEDFDDLNQ